MQCKVPIKHLLEGAFDGLSNIKIMEICGTHTMEIAKAGIKSMLPEGVTLISGPGCPVCVTPSGMIDNVLELSNNKEIVIATFGDMLRVPGSIYGDNLLKRRAMGAEILICYSPMDALEYAQEHKDKKIVFLGVGFETTSPMSAVVIDLAKKMDIKNLFVYSMHKQTPPVMKHLAKQKAFDVDALICPGHVATIIGADAFEFAVSELKLPSVVTGFETEDIVMALVKIGKMIKSNQINLINQYTRGVTDEGNLAAIEITNKIFETADSIWRGLSVIGNSGLKIRKEYSEFDAQIQFELPEVVDIEVVGCKCANVISGQMRSIDCPLFNKICTPENPVGPCMVSSEGACAAAYKYGGLNVNE